MPPRPSRRSFLKSIAGLPLLGAAGTFQISSRAADAKLPFASDNEKVAKAREIGLSILKPTPAQIEHGLRLHAESVVFESYGFAPRCAVDARTPSAARWEALSPQDSLDGGRSEAMSGLS